MAKKITRKITKVYELTISLLHTKPLVWRKVLAHEFIELEELHMLIQMSMGWESKHLYSFEINCKTYSDSETALEVGNMFDLEDSEEKEETLTWLGGFYNPNTFDPNFINKNFLWSNNILNF